MAKGYDVGHTFYLFMNKIRLVIQYVFPIMQVVLNCFAEVHLHTA